MFGAMPSPSQRVLRTNLAESWTLDSLAEVRQMARLLCSTDLSIAEAARAVGWTDAKYASRCFRTSYGISPSEFGRQQPTPSAC